MEENRKLKVYLETSFVSYLTGGPTLDAKVAADQAFTRLWWESERDKTDVFVSGYTIAECEAGDQGKSKDRLEAIKGVAALSGDVEWPILTHFRRLGRSFETKDFSALKS